MIIDRGEKRNGRLSSKGAQSLLEYIFLIGIVTMVLFAMNQIFKRGIQGIIKITADQIGNQQNAEQKIIRGGAALVNATQQVDPKAGHLVEAYTSTRANIGKDTRELRGGYDYIFDDLVLTYSNSLVNLGFTNKE